VFPEVLVVPPVAFDRRCYRIGYGAGFYDRTIPILRHMHPVLVLGFAFACQEVEAVPDEQHDVPLDAIATDAELIRPGAR
jgi:5-formyltetrahydrofolate cyclo-ligase